MTKQPWQPKQKRRNDEDKLQMAAVDWTLWNFPDLLFFHVPNGGHRPDFMTESGERISLEAIRLKKMGVRRGVADVLIFPDDIPKMAAEFKIWPNKQSDDQIQFQKHWERTGGKYRLCYTIEEYAKFFVDCGLKPKYPVPVSHERSRKQMKQYAWFDLQRPLGS